MLLTQKGLGCCGDPAASNGHLGKPLESNFCYDNTSTDKSLVNSNLTFREGLQFKGEATYTPRLVCIDLNGALKSLKQEGVLYEDLNSMKQPPLWGGKLDVHSSIAEEKNQFLQDLESSDVTGAKDEDKDICMDTSSDSKVNNLYNLDESVEVWSDFLRVHLHPKSIYVLKDHQFNSNEESFSVFGFGKELFDCETHRDELEDRIRYFAEECDYLQGFHVLTDTQNGFSGLGSSMTQYLREEFSKSAIFAIPSIPHCNENTKYHALNSLLCYHHMFDSSSLFAPISLFENSCEKPGLSYQV
ncbi:Protein misato 1 [Nymphon striatum]|nr:Protein misato 1 [Nymphon striatum]